MFQCLTENSFNVGVGKGIIDSFSITAVFNKLGLFKDSKLMRYSRLCHIKEVSDIADTHFGFEEDENDSGSGRIAEHLKQFSYIIEDLLIGDNVTDLINNFLMDLTIFANILEIFFHNNCSNHTYE